MFNFAHFYDNEVGGRGELAYSSKRGFLNIFSSHSKLLKLLFQVVIKVVMMY
jgi:hypothetical protein